MLRTSSCTRLALFLILLPSLLVAAPAKSRKVAFLQSLGKKNAALVFFGSELIFIGGMYSLRAYGASARDDYEAMAARYAGVVGSHGHDYYVDVGNWMQVEDFNERRLQERNFDQLYVLESDRWHWDTDQHRAEMRTRRIKSDRAYNSVVYLIGGVVLNHIASAIHAGRASASHKVSDAGSLRTPSWAVGLQPVSRHGGLRVSLTHAF